MINVTALINIIDTDQSANKSASRYLYRTHPDLWQSIVDETSFLPESAKPKQRIWHIINGVYERPTCPVTGEFVKWVENRYLITANRSAKGKMQKARGDFSELWSPERNNKRAETNKRLRQQGLVKKRRKLTAEENATQKARREQTCLARYGVPHATQAAQFRKLISDHHVAHRGATPPHLKSLRELYYESVRYHTQLNWRNHFDKINPQRLNRSKNSLDHIYSIHQGFQDSIPPYIIGHWTNLRVIPLSKNSSKGSECHKSKEQLFDDYFTNQSDSVLLLDHRLISPF